MKAMVLITLLTVSLLSGSCAPGQNFDVRLKSIVKPHRFSITRWESRALPQEVQQWLSHRQKRIDDETGTVIEYFSITERIKALKSAMKATNAGNEAHDLASPEAELSRLEERKEALQGVVERIMAKQVRNALTQQGIFNPMIALRMGFPPVNFKLETPPYLLVISSRERIESMREVTLKPSLILKEMEGIEARVDELGVSSLVVGLDGLGATYPTLVNKEADLRSAINTILEEWLHQYLAFKPLGFRYLLDLSGLSRNYEIAIMNETLVGMVSQEIGSIVYKKYYARYENGAEHNQKPESEFDFNGEMRKIRETVDTYLGRGEIESAEKFMEQKRQYLVAKGYYIRKLNQAYFAFHGTYADKPAFLSPIGLEMKELRRRSASVKDFLNTMAVMTSRQDLKESIK